MIDFHCHIDLFARPDEVIREAQRRRIYVLAVTTTPKAWRVLNNLLNGCDRIRPALGLHPELARERESEVGLFDELVSQTQYVGEIGLDGSATHRDSMPAQKRTLDAILQSCASAGGKILSLHSRGAASEVLDMLEGRPGAGPAVFHWFSGSFPELERAIAFGAWFSVGPAMLKSKKGLELVSRMPRSKVLTETDGPFAQQAGRPMMPWDVSEAERMLASVWKVPPAETRVTLMQNFRLLLGRRREPS